MPEPKRLGAVLGRATLAHEALLSVPQPDEAVGDLGRESRRQTLLALRIGLTAADERRVIDGKVSLSFGRSIAAVKTWLTERDAPPLLFLLGTTGRGKTLAIAWALSGQGRKEAFFTAPQLERLHEERFGDDAKRYRDRRHDRILIAVDDIGTELRPETMSAALAELVDIRRGVGHRTIIASNLSAAALRKRYPDARMWSRLEESARFIADAGADARARKVKRS